MNRAALVRTLVVVRRRAFIQQDTPTVHQGVSGLRNHFLQFIAITEECDSPFRLAGGDKERKWILFYLLEPKCQVCGVVWAWLIRHF